MSDLDNIMRDIASINELKHQLLQKETALEDEKQLVAQYGRILRKTEDERDEALRLLRIATTHTTMPKVTFQGSHGDLDHRLYAQNLGEVCYICDLLAIIKYQKEDNDLLYWTLNDLAPCECVFDSSSPEPTARCYRCIALNNS
jgi:hypothetical protein